LLTWGNSLLDWFYPPHCYHCGAMLSGTRNRFLCLACWRALIRTRIGGAVCPVCGLPLDAGEGETACVSCQLHAPNFDLARSIFPYAGPVGSLIVSYKFQGDFYLGPRVLGKAIAKGWLPGEIEDAEAVVPVPLHPRRQRERGYNQALLLARVVARSMGRPLEARALRRERYTAQQTRLAARKRWDNVRGAFRAGRGDLAGRCLLLIDDVMTTGATASECARVLKKAGAGKVLVLTLARTRP